MHALPARPLKKSGGRGFGTYADGMESTFFILAILGFYLGGVGAIDDPLLSRGEHRSPAKILKDTFLLSYFCVTKSAAKVKKRKEFLF